jgi:hypothetical protein
VGQECHAIAKEDDGPRGDPDFPKELRDEYSNLILMCNIHHKVIDDQEKYYTVEKLHEMKKDHEEWVKNSLTTDETRIKGGLADPSNLHYYWHKERIPSIWSSLNLPSKTYIKGQGDSPSFNRELWEKLMDIIKQKGVWDLKRLIEKNDTLEYLIGTCVTLKGHFDGDMKSLRFYLDEDSEWDKETMPTLFTSLKINDNSYKVNLEVNPYYVTTGSSFLKLKQNPYIQVVGVVWNANTENKEIFIAPLHMCPNS